MYEYCVQDFVKGRPLGRSCFFRRRDLSLLMVSDDPDVVLKWILKVFGRYPN